MTATQQASDETHGENKDGLFIIKTQTEVLTHPTLAYFLSRLSLARTVEERLAVLCEMKRIPHFMAAFIRLTGHDEECAVTPNVEEVSFFRSLTSTEAVEESINATQKVNASVKSLMDYYEVLQGQIQELKDEITILRKEKRDFSEEMRGLEQKANEQGERLSSLRSTLEAEMKSTKESVSTQLGRVIVFNDEIQEHKKRISELEAKVARHSEDFESLRPPPENGTVSVNEISLLSGSSVVVE